MFIWAALAVSVACTSLWACLSWTTASLEVVLGDGGFLIGVW